MKRPYAISCASHHSDIGPRIITETLYTLKEAEQALSNYHFTMKPRILIWNGEAYSRPKTETYAVNEIDYRDFEAVVETEFAIHEFSFAAAQECGNDSVHLFKIEQKQPLSESEAEQLKKFIESDGCGGVQPVVINNTLFQELVNRGVLEPGNYLVSVCW